MLPPVIDARGYDEVKKEMLARLSAYLPEYKPPEGSGDAGIALLSAVAAVHKGTIDRLNRVPHKNYAEFLNTIGVRQSPPVAARAPVSFTPEEGAKAPVLVPAGAKLSAKNENGETVIFETENDLNVMPVSLEKVFFTVQPEDRLYDASGIGAGAAAFRLVRDGARDLQAHRMYIGHDDLLNISQPATISIKMTGCGSRPGGEQGAGAELFDCGYWDGETWRAFSNISVSSQDDAYAFILKKNDGPGFEKTEIGGIESFWIKIELKDMAPKNQWMDGFEFTGLSLSVSSASLKPGVMFYNTIPLIDKALAQDGKTPVFFQPFGSRPRTYDTFYIASADAFSSKKSRIKINYNTDGRADRRRGLINGPFKPPLSYEYWNGKGWFALPGLNADTGAANGGCSEIISFICPDDIEPAEVNGREDYWIRIRIASGDYGREKYNYNSNTGFWTFSEDDICAPGLGELAIDVEPAASAEPAADVKIVTQNNNFYTQTQSGGAPAGIRPFRLGSDGADTLYFGFSGAFYPGVFAAFFHIEHDNRETPAYATRWEYYSGESDIWRRIAADDETASLTETGAIAFLIPGDIMKTFRFGESLTWLRCVFTPAGEAARDGGPILLKAAYINTVWASQRETIKNETLALIAGFEAGGLKNYYGDVRRFSKRPAISCEVFVNEAQALSLREQEELLAEGGRKAARKLNADGETAEFWVRWDCVQNLLSSGAIDRHYEIDYNGGYVMFGDGVYGKTPPEGRAAVRADYVTGGGSGGNVASLSVNKLLSAIPLIAGVSNPLPSAGGYDAESAEAALRRGPSILRHRGRGVTAEDLTSLVSEYSGIAKVNCLPLYSRDKSGFPGCVTLVVIPESSQTKPELPNELKLRLARHIIGRAPAHLEYNRNLFIIGPEYVTVTAAAVIVTKDIYVNSNAAKRAEMLLRGFFHPLSGGPDGRGWQFGAAPHMPDLYRLLESVEGADYLDRIALTLDNGAQTVTVTDETVFPSAFCNPYNILCSGNHHIDAVVRVTG